MPKNHDIIEIEGEVLNETAAGYRFWDGEYDDDGSLTGVKIKKTVWLPKSQCEWDSSDNTMQMPEWLAEEKGLI